MNFKEYEEKAITTKCYDDSVAIPYVALGLCGEVGEFFEKVNQEIEVDLVLKEVGDVLWYIASLRVELNLKDLEWPEYSKEEKFLDPFILIGEVGKVAEQIKKYLRDDWKKDVSIDFPESRKEIIHESLQLILKSFEAICQYSFSTNLEVIAQQNIEKLAARKKNNTIHGSGDLR